jgi:hypothetical protein
MFAFASRKLTVEAVAAEVADTSLGFAVEPDTFPLTVPLAIVASFALDTTLAAIVVAFELPELVTSPLKAGIVVTVEAVVAVVAVEAFPVKFPVKVPVIVLFVNVCVALTFTRSIELY